ncbi:MAG: LysR family transcriptional regulator [Gemmatimonadaceae bacterium]|nr:LysR family transcriptional regulator [Gemmatimonadaceae bacterium]
MNLRQLQYFIAVADWGGFRQAAARLNVAQPALSRQVKSMESELGLLLLDRTSRQVALTPAGTVYLRAVRRVLDDVANGVRRARLASAGQVGRCVIAAQRTAHSPGLLPRAAELIAMRYPEIELTITEADVPDHWDMLRRGEADVVVGPGPVPGIEGIDAEHLWMEAIRCVLVPAGHALAHRASVRLADLAGESFLAIEPSLMPKPWLRLDQALERVGVSRAQVRVVRSMSSVRSLVAAGHGCSLVSDAYLQQPPAGTAVVEIEDLSVEVEIMSHWRATDGASVAHIVRDMLREACHGAIESSAPAMTADAQELEREVVTLPRALELRQLDYLRGALDSASIGEAAGALGIAQPVLSRQLRDLERTIGVALLKRTHRGVSATAAGALLVRETRRVDERLADARQSAHRAYRGAMGECMLATISTPMSMRVVASVLAECTRSDPEISIEVLEVPSISQEPALLSATVDVAFSVLTSMAPRDPSIVREHMLDDPLDCVLVARDHPLSGRPRVRLPELGTLPFLFAARESHPALHDDVMQQLQRLELCSPINGTFQSLHLRWSQVASGRGWCLGFRSQRVHPPSGTVAIAVDGLLVPWGMELLWRASEDRMMVSTLVEAFRRAAAAIRGQPGPVHQLGTPFA